jgi:hypothetical protein
MLTYMVYMPTKMQYHVIEMVVMMPQINMPAAGNTKSVSLRLQYGKFWQLTRQHHGLVHKYRKATKRTAVDMEKALKNNRNPISANINHDIDISTIPPAAIADQMWQMGRSVAFARTPILPVCPCHLAQQPVSVVPGYLTLLGRLHPFMLLCGIYAK